MNADAGAVRPSPRLRPLRARPGRALRLAAYAIAAVVAGVVLIALDMPGLGARFGSAGNGVEVSFGSRTQLVAPQAAVTISSRRGYVHSTAEQLVPDYAPGGNRAAIAGFYRNLDRIGQIGAEPDAAIAVETSSGSVRAPLRHRPRGFGDLSVDVWLLLLQASVVGLTAAWVRIQRPDDRASALFAISGAGVALAAFSGAVFDARELSAPGQLLRTAMGLNMIGSTVSGYALSAMFLHLPRRIAPNWVAPAIVGGALAAGLLEALGIIPLAGFYALLPGSIALVVPIVVLQWRETRGDPAARAVLRWIGAASLAGAALLSTGMAVPALLGVPAFGTDGMAIIPVFAIYGAIAFGFGGVRAFALEAWSVRLIVGAAAVLLLVLSDMLLMALLRIDQPVALTLALIGAGYLYFPLRARLWARIGRGGGTAPPDALYSQATAVAFARGPEARRDAWRALLGRSFEPMDIARIDGPLAAPELGGDGEWLDLPALADEGPLRLRFARRGERLFGPGDLSAATALVALIGELDRARAEYARGVTEERTRIARDLHDDVSALLLTGLHRQDVKAVRGDVRQALGEIRTMVSSLSQQAVGLTAILADLRFETAERARAGGIECDWPIDASPHEVEPMLDYARHKALVSSVREAVSNVLRHSGAKHMTVTIRRVGGRLTVEISDDGRGLAPQPGRRGSGNGLPNMRARLSAIGGECTIADLPAGCRVHLDIPLGTPPAAE